MRDNSQLAETAYSSRAALGSGCSSYPSLRTQRALDALLRPYPMAVAGDPLRMAYDRRKDVFEFGFRHDPQVVEPTIVYLPQRAYPRGFRVTVSDGEVMIDTDDQRLTNRHTGSRRVHFLRLDRI